MRNCLYIAVIATAAVFAGCNKQHNNNDIDLQKYENQLYVNYNAALGHHNALIAKTPQADYNKMMYNVNDSLFTCNFYEFCSNMLQNGGLKGHGMHGKGMMNGVNTEAKHYVDSLYRCMQSGINKNFTNIDSLMINKMNRCGMMSSQTNNINNCYAQMQALRKNHNAIFGNRN